MRNETTWRPTKFIQTKRGLRASRDTRYVSTASRFVADLIAPRYESALRAHARGRLLDLGCGFVPLYATYRDLVDRVVCADWQNTLHPSPYLDLIADLNQPLPLPAASFDTVVLTDVLEHVADPAALMGEVGRVLCPGGKLILGVPFFYWLHETPFDFYRYTEHALRYLCGQVQLSVLSLDPYGGILEIIVDLSSKGIFVAPAWVGRLLRPVHAVVSRMLTFTRAARRFSRATAHTFPLGYVLIAERCL